MKKVFKHHEIAFHLWFDLGGNITYSGLASRLFHLYGIVVTASTLRKWASRYKWKKYSDEARIRQQNAYEQIIRDSCESRPMKSPLKPSEFYGALAGVLLNIVIDYFDNNGKSAFVSNVRELGYIYDKACKITDLYNKACCEGN